MRSQIYVSKTKIALYKKNKTVVVVSKQCLPRHSTPNWGVGDKKGLISGRFGRDGTNINSTYFHRLCAVISVNKVQGGTSKYTTDMAAPNDTRRKWRQQVRQKALQETRMQWRQWQFDPTTSTMRSLEELEATCQRWTSRCWLRLRL